MNTERQKMIDEKEKLNAEIEKIEAFINGEFFKEVNPQRMSLFNMQLLTMKLYAQILVEQIAWIND